MAKKRFSHWNDLAAHWGTRVDRKRDSPLETAAAKPNNRTTMQGTDPRIEELACSLLRGEQPVWPWPETARMESLFTALCVEHGIAPLAAHLIAIDRREESWPAGLVTELKRLAWGTKCLQELNDAELAALLDRLRLQRIRSLILKGAGLARSHFPQPHLRPRTDTDLLIRRPDLEATLEALREMGYRQGHTVTGELLMYQISYLREEPNGYRHTFDVHWRISNPQVFAEVLTFEELHSRAVPLEITPEVTAWTLSAPDSLLLACLHRVAHHRDRERLIWLYDIHLLAQGLDSEGTELFRGLAVRKRLTTVVRDGLLKTAQLLGTRIDELIDPAWPESGSGDEPTAEFVAGTGRRRDILWSDFRAVPGWGKKLRLLKEHLFPPPEFMFRHYSTRSRLLLPFLYVHRAIRGAWRILLGRD